MFESWVDRAIQYLRERYPLRVFLPVATGLTMLAFVDEGPKAWLDFLLTLLTVLAMVFQFRLWDDLGDQPYDRFHHPRRVLSRASELSLYWQTVAGFGIFNLALVMLLDRRYLWLAAFNALALLWYEIVHIEWRRSIPGRHLTLLKYPAFILSIAPGSGFGSRLILSMAAAYLCGGIYELFHDGEMRSQPAARRLAVTEAFLLATVAIAGGYSH